MKKMVLKKWVMQVLFGIIMISLILLASDSKDLKTFVIVHLIALGVFIGCVLVLKKYGREI